MKLQALFIAGTGLLLCTAPTGAQDLTAAQALYEETCKNCHGPKAQGMGSFPKLANKEEDHISDRLNQYRAGEKVGPNTALMQPHAADLSDDDIANLAAYITTAFD